MSDARTLTHRQTLTHTQMLDMKLMGVIDAVYNKMVNYMASHGKPMVAPVTLLCEVIALICAACNKDEEVSKDLVRTFEEVGYSTGSAGTFTQTERKTFLLHLRNIHVTGDGEDGVLGDVPDKLKELVQRKGFDGLTNEEILKSREKTRPRRNGEPFSEESVKKMEEALKRLQEGASFVKTLLPAFLDRVEKDVKGLAEEMHAIHGDVENLHGKRMNKAHMDLFKRVCECGKVFEAEAHAGVSQSNVNEKTAKKVRDELFAGQLVHRGAPYNGGRKDQGPQNRCLLKMFEKKSAENTLAKFDGLDRSGEGASSASVGSGNKRKLSDRCDVDGTALSEDGDRNRTSAWLVDETEVKRTKPNMDITSSQEQFMRSARNLANRDSVRETPKKRPKRKQLSMKRSPQKIVTTPGKEDMVPCPICGEYFKRLGLERRHLPKCRKNSAAKKSRSQYCRG